MSAGARAWRNRALSAAAVIALVAAFRAAEPDPQARATALYLTVIALGYGHLVGAAWFARRRIGSLAPRVLGGALGAAFVASALGVALLVYLEAALHSSLLLVPLLALSVWHAFENDLVLPALYEAGRVPPLPRSRRHHAAAAALSLVAIALFAASLGGHGPLLPAEIFALWTLYHVVSWLVLSLERGRPRVRAAVVAVHVLSAAPCAALLLAPLPWEHPLRVALFAPSVYLFWASLHVAQTLWVRGLAPGVQR